MAGCFCTHKIQQRTVYEDMQERGNVVMSKRAKKMLHEATGKVRDDGGRERGSGCEVYWIKRSKRGKMDSL